MKLMLEYGCDILIGQGQSQITFFQFNKQVCLPLHTSIIVAVLFYLDLLIN